MNFAIVGGGFSGLMTALSLARQGHAVQLFEAGDALGGIVRDAVEPHGRFLRGCQYINIDPLYQRLWDDIGQADLQVFPHHYGAWNNLFGPTIVHHDFAQVLVPGPLGDCPPPPAQPPATLADYMRQFEDRVASPLGDWARRLCDVDDLVAANAVHLQLSRIGYADDTEGVLTRKRNDPHADRLLGVPRSRFEPPLPVQLAALPLHGFDAHLGRLAQCLQAWGGHVTLNAPVKPVKGPGGRCQLRLRGEAIDADWVVWCANPTPLLQVLCDRRLDSTSVPCVHVYATLSTPAPLSPVYYQTFGRDHPLLRLFTYDLGGPKLTLEALDEGWTVEQLVACANGVMRDLGWDSHITAASLAPQRRYTLSTHDARCIQDFAAAAPSLGVVTGGWQHYGRDPRLHDIHAQLTALGAL
jgi:hypothetical protein